MMDRASVASLSSPAIHSNPKLTLYLEETKVWRAGLKIWTTPFGSFPLLKIMFVVCLIVVYVGLFRTKYLSLKSSKKIKLWSKLATTK